MQMTALSSEPAAGWESTVRAIEALDLGPIKFKLMNDEGARKWTREAADQVEILYKRFLLLLAKYPRRSVVPTKIIDEFWHAHILDTMKYEQDTKRIFGRFLHHFPYFGLRGKDDRLQMERAFRATAELYLAEFGDEGPSFLDEHNFEGAVCGDHDRSEGVAAIDYGRSFDGLQPTIQ